jgi:cytochrome P450 family 138
VIETDSAVDEKVPFRGVAFTPKDGGRIVVRRREPAVA